jgi:tripartite-type tricarboxylate transporter receptor subunit TctC
MRYWRGVLLVSAAMLPGPLLSQGFPSKPVRIISPYPPGGGNDTLARTLQPKLSEGLRQQVIVDNRPGANTIIGTELAARSAPDGYTMVLVPNSHTSNPYLYPKLPYDAVKDFTPISIVGTSPLVLAMHPSVPVKDVRSLIALAKARPGELAFATSGIGSVGHMAGSLFEMSTGVKLQHIPYKGTAPMLIDVISGQVAFTFSSALGVVQHLRAGRLRAIAVTPDKRTPALPDLPTIAEAGVPGYAFVLWYGLLAPAGTPTEVVTRLNAEVVKAAQDTDVRTRLANQGVGAVGSSAAQFAQLIASDLKKYSTLVKASGAKAE